MKAEDFLPHIHPQWVCEGDAPCTFHSPSEHRMRDWDVKIRFDRFDLRTDRICPHGIEHPDPDSLSFIERALGTGAEAGVHDCDGCCHE